MHAWEVVEKFEVKLQWVLFCVCVLLESCKGDKSPEG